MMIERVNELVDVMLHGDQDEVELQQVEAVLDARRLNRGNFPGSRWDSWEGSVTGTVP